MKITMEVQTLPGILHKNLRDNPDYVAQYSKDSEGNFQPTTFAELHREVLAYAAGLREAGIKRKDHVGFVSDNRKEWMVTSFALHSLGAVDVPRGCDSAAEELAYIISFADCETVILENESQLKKMISIRGKISAVKLFIVIDNDFDKGPYQADLSGIRVMGYKEIMESGKALGSDASIEEEIRKGQIDDLATIIFTSGTTGEPKGVMLTHRNILHQSSQAPICISNRPGETWLTVLPVWHSFERAIQYCALHYGGALAYSKPVGKILLEDCQKMKPHWITSVPRIWEAVRAGIYRKVAAGSAVKRGIFSFFVSVSAVHQNLKNLILGRTPHFRRRIVFIDALFAFIPFLLLTPLRALGGVLVFKNIRNLMGGRLRAGVSGGAALPEAVDKFFAAAGILILEGYGMTEAAPILSVRLHDKPVPKTIGPPFPNMEVIVRDPETGKEMRPMQMGVIMARGPQIMQGYYKKPEETSKAVDGEGWLNTGDIGVKTYRGEIKITGRAKDTIVLLGGENIEPVPIENKIRDSIYIDHALVLGSEQKYLGALIVPNLECVETYAKENNIPYVDTIGLYNSPEIRELIQSEISARINKKTGFRGFETVFRSVILPKPFEPGLELSGKQDYKRHVIKELYKKEVAELFRD